MANDKNFKIKNGLSAKRYLGTNGTKTDTTSTAYYQLTAAVYDSKSFSPASEDTVPRGITFKPDGTKMYIAGSGNDRIYQYTLATANDVSTASYDSKSFLVTSQDTEPYDMFFKPDGTKMYVVTYTTQTVFQYTLSTAWDVSTASYDSKSFNLTQASGGPHGLSFNDDGTKLFVDDYSPPYMYEYDLSTAYDVSTASYNSVSLNLQPVLTQPRGHSFNSSGTKLFVISDSADKIFQYSLSTPFDLSTASYDNIEFSVAAQNATPFHVAFNGDGSKMYMLGFSAPRDVHQYSTDSTLQETDIDLSTGNYFNLSLIYATTLSFSNPPEAGKAFTFNLEISNSAETTTWPSGIKWEFGETPIVYSDKQVFTFLTVDGGTTYYAKKAGETFS